MLRNTGLVAWPRHKQHMSNGVFHFVPCTACTSLVSLIVHSLCPLTRSKPILRQVLLARTSAGALLDAIYAPPIHPLLSKVSAECISAFPPITDSALKRRSCVHHLLHAIHAPSLFFPAPLRRSVVLFELHKATMAASPLRHVLFFCFLPNHRFASPYLQQQLWPLKWTLNK